jgi:hypothetical protein
VRKQVTVQPCAHPAASHGAVPYIAANVWTAVKGGEGVPPAGEGGRLAPHGCIAEAGGPTLGAYPGAPPAPAPGATSCGACCCSIAERPGGVPEGGP